MTFCERAVAASFVSKHARSRRLEGVDEGRVGEGGKGIREPKRGSVIHARTSRRKGKLFAHMSCVRVFRWYNISTKNQRNDGARDDDDAQLQEMRRFGKLPDGHEAD